MTLCRIRRKYTSNQHTKYFNTQLSLNIYIANYMLIVRPKISLFLSVGRFVIHKTIILVTGQTEMELFILSFLVLGGWNMYHWSKMVLLQCYMLLSQRYKQRTLCDWLKRFYILYHKRMATILKFHVTYFYLWKCTSLISSVFCLKKGFPQNFEFYPVLK